VDQIWQGRPTRPRNGVQMQALDLCGQTVESKFAAATKEMTSKGVDFMIATALDEIAWALNFRGSDIPYNPVFFSHLILNGQGESILFTDNPVPLLDKVQVLPYHEFIPFVKANLQGKRIWLDPLAASCATLSALGLPLRGIEDHSSLHLAMTSFKQAKPVKNKEEIQAMKRAQHIDGIALVQFLAWIDQGGFEHEVQAAHKLERFRKESPLYLGPSFETISSIGGNGAIIHYKPSAESSAREGNCFLVDSGGQYPGGTTDTTRTVWLKRQVPENAPSLDTVSKSYTMVLKSHVALACARFPQGITAHRLDSIARAPMWQAGLDYKHGTGHGVGAQLCVHETPTISSQCPDVNFGVVQGVCLTNEPGYYLENQYGIRIENLMLAVPCPGLKDFLQFETITLCPFSRDLIRKELLTEEEIKWIDDYHIRCWEEFKDELQLDIEAKKWLEWATRPL